MTVKNVTDVVTVKKLGKMNMKMNMILIMYKFYL